MKTFARQTWLPRSVIFAAIVATAGVVSQAREHALNYLKDGQVDVVMLLAPPPLSDSPEQAADMDEVKIIYHSASSNDMAAAQSEKKFSVFNFTEVVGPFFQTTNLLKTTAFFEKIQNDAAVTTDRGKLFFRRPRPYTSDPSLANGKLEKSFSYPSGHSTESMVLALVLAELFPGNRAAILDHARTMGWHRVQIARHYPMDIYAGRVLAQAIVRGFKQDPNFKKDFEEVKTEIQARLVLAEAVGHK